MNTKSSFALVIAATVLATVRPASAQTAGYIVGSPQATVRGGASQNVDIIEGGGTGTASGTVSIKFAATPFDSARKYYAKFTLTGNPNTNGPLYLQYSTVANSQQQDVSVWTLNQDFATFASSTQTWNTAQANDINSGSGFLTSGAFTATYYQNFLSAATANVIGRTHQLNGPWAHMLRAGNVIYLALSSTNDIGGNGLRLAVNSLAIGYDTLTTGLPPSLGAMASLTVAQTQTSATNAFTVNDPEDGPNSLTPTATSANQAIVADADIHFDGTGANRTVYVVAGATAGTTTITVTITDAAGNRATRAFTVTVTLFNLPPVIIAASGTTNVIAPTNTLLNLPVTIPFSVSDAESPNTNLTVTATVASYSAGVLQSAVLSGTAFNTNLSLLITPQPGVDGVGVVQISCSDTNGNTTTVGFCVMIRASTKVLFVDHFDYDGLNTKLTDQAPGFWTRRNASAQSVFLRAGTDPATGAKVAWIRPNSGAEDLAAPLIGGPYGPSSSRAVLYTKFTATFADQAAAGPGINIITNNDPGAAFFRLSQGRTSTEDFLNYLVVATNNVSDPDNFFRVSVGNGTGTNSTAWPNDFAKPVNLGTETGPITLITRYEVATAKATLWVNAGSEADPHVDGTDNQAAVPVGYVGLFQARGYGDIYIDDMTVTVLIKPLITAVAAPVGGNLTFDFNAHATDVAGDFSVERAANVNGSFGNVSATITSLGGGNFRATVAAPGTQGFYKVKRTAVVAF